MNIFKKGSYRIYFNIGKIGFKIPRINFNTQNSLLCFLTSIIMNLLEYKRYKHYKKLLHLCPVYLTLGIINVVRHCENLDPKEEGFFTLDINYGIISDYGMDNLKMLNGIATIIDYGDFNVDRYNSQCVRYIEYK